MARSAMQIGRGWSRGRASRSGWGELAEPARKRLFEAGGFALMLASLLILLSLLTYDPGDPSPDTAADISPHNFLGHDGAALADVLLQTIGLAAYLIPLLLLGLSFRLLLHRPLRALQRRLFQLLLALLLGAFACSVLQTPLALPAGTGGAIGWALLRLAGHTGLAPLALPLAMTAAALVAALLLSIMGLSWGDWRAIGGGAGRGASRLAHASGRGTAVAAELSGRAARYWREFRRDF